MNNREANYCNTSISHKNNTLPYNVNWELYIIIYILLIVNSSPDVGKEYFYKVMLPGSTYLWKLIRHERSRLMLVALLIQ